MIFQNVRDWKHIEAELREQGFTRPKLLVVRELWFRLQIENIIPELSPEEIEDGLCIFAEAYDELPE